MEKCQCRPPYFPKYKDYDNCTFSMHASCISPNFTVFNFTTCVNCPVECEKNRWAVLFDWYNDWFSYVRNVEYGKYHEPIYRTLEKFSQSTGNQDIDIAAFQVEYLITIRNWPIFQLYFPSLAITVHNQIDDYTTNQFVSELGGAAGIVLGVSLYTIVKSEFFKLRGLWVKWIFSNRWSDWFVFCYSCKAAQTFHQDVVWFKNISKTVSWIQNDYKL